MNTSFSWFLRRAQVQFTVALAALGCLAASSVSSQTLRERIKERMHERRAEAPQSHKGAQPVQPPRGPERHVLTHSGLPRTYLLYVPESVDGSQPVPLVLAFHGGGGDAAYMADDARYGLLSKADAAGFIVAFPSGYSKLPSGRFATWNAGNCCGDARDRNIDDVGFVRAVVKQVQASHRIDSQRIYAAGMSNGGMMAHRLACDAADILAAVGSVAGTDGTRSCAPSRSVPVLHIHAKDDDHVLFNGGAGQGAFRDESKVTSFTSVPQTVSNWVSRNRCEAQPLRTFQGAGAYCEVHSGCNGQTQVQLCVTESGGHSWPGAEKVRRGKAPASQALVANDVLWGFFSRHRLGP
jgi:polyhydroxybutyrate depolymerase